MVWPLGRRIVLLPKQLLDGLPEDQTATIIAHELAHIRRRDDLLRFFELFVLCLYWWNPIQWWARRELHAAEEACCDALVLRTLPGGVCDYGEALLRTGQFVSAGLSSPALATGFGRTSSLKRRVEMILANRFSKPASGLQKLVMLGVAAAVLPLGGQAISDDGPTTDAVSDAQPKATDQKTDRGSEPLKSGGGRRRGSATVAKTPTSPAPAIHETAQLMASQQVSLYAKVAGFVRTIHADLGDRVQKGQVLAELDAPEMEAEVQRLRTMASKSIAELERHRAELARTQASRIELETQLQKHKAEFNRLKAMSDKGIATNAKVEEAQFALEAAYATHKTQDAVIAAAEAQAAAARADVDVAGAELRKAEAMLSYLQIRAPFEGIISSRSAVVGSLAQPPSQKRDAALFELVAVDPIRVVCHVSADAAARVTKGTPAFVRVRGDDGQGVAAKIARLGATLEPVSRSLRVEIDLPNPGEKLRPGMWAAVVIPTPAAADSGTVDRAEPARRPRAGGQTGIEGLAVSPDSKVVAVVVGAGRSMFELELWDIARGGVLSKTEVQGSASSVEFSSDGTRVAVFSSDAKRVRIFNVPTGEALERTSAKQWALRQATPPVGESPEP